MKAQVEMVVSTGRFHFPAIQIMDIRSVDIVRLDFVVLFSSKDAYKKIYHQI